MHKSKPFQAAAALAMFTGLGLACWALFQHTRRHDGRLAARGPTTFQAGQGTMTGPPGPSPEEIRKQRRDRAVPLLDATDGRARDAIEAQLSAIDRFFSEAEARTPRFAAEVLGFAGQWRLVADHLPLGGGGRHHAFLREAFDRCIFPEERLRAEIQAAVDGYLLAERDLEDRLLVNLRHDLADLPGEGTGGTLDQDAIRAAIGRALGEASAHAAEKLRADVTRELAVMAIGELASQVLLRSALHGTLAATGMMSWGVGLAACLAVDRAVAWTWDRWSDPQGKLGQAVRVRLGELRRLVIEGSAEAPGLRARLVGLSRQRGARRREVILTALEAMGGGS